MQKIKQIHKTQKISFMEQVKPGKYVKFIYDLYEIDNEEVTLMYSATHEHPDQTIFGGEDGLLPAVSAELEGKSVGNTFDITLEPENAFGTFDEKLIMELDRELFTNEEGEFDAEHIRSGAPVTMMTEQGFPVSGLVLMVSPAKVTVDFNHPMAGKRVRFKGEILEVRDATEEELHPHCGCGCGCDHDHCGDCGGGCH